MGSSELTALWATLVLGAPTLVLGLALSSPDGLGLSITQLILAVPVGALLAATMVALVAWAGSYNGVPTVHLLLPPFGRLGEILLGAAGLWFAVLWAASQLRLGAVLAQGGLAELAWPAPATGVIMILLGVLVVILVLSGIELMATAWVRRFAFWAAMAVALAAIWAFTSKVDFVSLAEAPSSPAFWLGVDAVVALGLLWVLFVPDQTRFAVDESAAANGVGYGFGIPAIVLLLVGGTLGLTGVAATAEALGGAMVAVAPGVVGGAALLLWVVSAEVLGPAVADYSGGVWASTLIRRVGGRGWGVLLAVVTVVLAMASSQDRLSSWLDLARTVFAPVVAVLLADFYLVRRKEYQTDDMYRSRSHYGLVNPWGWAAWFLGFVTAQWSAPAGPATWQEWVTATVPGGIPFAERIGLPPLLIAMVVAALAYVAVGLWRVKEEVYVAELRL